jgi:PAS domain S-box-containing protein
LFCIEGNWEWSFQASSVFCSDVLFFPNGQEFEGSSGLILPKDNVSVREWVLNLETDTVQNFGFHIITSYGKIEWLKLTGLVEVSEEKEFFSSFEQEQLDIFIRNKQLQERSEREQLYLKSYELVEKVCDTGMWIMNSTTFETFYSDSVYRIHGLAPQSLNAHFYTFIPFIHPEDGATFIAAFESAYKSRLPLQLEYRLLLNRTEIKYIRLTTQWSHSYKGEGIMTGIVEDLTLQKANETKLFDVANELKLADNTLRHAERMGRIGSWRMNLLTKKIVYSNNIYRLYGLKSTGQPLDADTLLKYVHPDDRDLVEAANSRISKEYLEIDIEFRIIRPDGKIRYLAQKSRVLINATNEVIVIGTVADVSAAVSSNKKLKKIQADQELQRIALEQMEKTTNSGSWFRDIETGEQTWSKGMYELLDLKQGAFQLSENLFINLIQLEDRKIFTDHLDTVINGGKSETEFDFRIHRKGEIRYVHAKFAILKTNEKLLFSSTLQDRTEERYLQQHLTEQLRMTDMLSDASMNKIFVCDSNNNIIRWNKRCEEAFGVKREKLMGKNFFDAFPQLKTAEILGYFERVSQGETIDIKDQKAILPGGYQDVLMVPVRDENEKIIATLTVINDTTKEFELKQQLTERLRFIEKLLEESVDRVIVLDHHMNYQYWNRRAEEYYGIKKEEILGKNILELFPAFINHPSHSQFRQALRGETVFMTDSGNRAAKDHFEAYLIPFKDDKGIVTGILWIVHDLTKDRQLKQQQVETLSIIDALSEGYYKLDKEFRVKYINPSAEKFFNITKENFIGKIIWDAVPDEVGGPIYKALIKAMEDKESIRGEYYSISARKWVFLSVTPTVDGISVMFFDIQKQKDDEHFIQLTVDTSPNMIGVNSLRENKWIYVNKATEKFFGYTNEEIHRMDDGSWASLVHTDDIGVLYELVRKVVASQPGTIHEAQYRALRKDGEYRWLFNRSTVFKTDEKGLPTEILCIAFDNTEKVRAEEKLKESKDWLRSVLDNASTASWH